MYSFQADDDYISEGFEDQTTNTNIISASNSESGASDDETKKKTDSSFKATCFNIRHIGIILLLLEAIK